jgi:hypothetical protein
MAVFARFEASKTDFFIYLKEVVILLFWEEKPLKKRLTEKVICGFGNYRSDHIGLTVELPDENQSGEQWFANDRCAHIKMRS